MNTVIDPRLKQLQLYLTASYPCSYLPQNEARSQVVSPSHGVGRDTYSHLIRLGFRRSGLFTYRPSCDTCQACLPFRVLARHFLPTRSQKRAWVKHQHLLARVMPPAFQAAHYELFMRYQSDRHSDGGMNHDSAEQYTQFLLRSQVESYLVEFTDPTTKAIKIVSLIDVTEDGISAVYTFYEPESHMSYGTYAVMWTIEYAKLHALPYVYLGYWIKTSKKMAYKSRFCPAEIYVGGQWISTASG